MLSYLAEMPGTYSRTPASRCRRRPSVNVRGLTLRAGLRPNRYGKCFSLLSSLTCEGRVGYPGLSGEEILSDKKSEIP